MSAINSKIEEAREKAIDVYISNCLEKYGKSARRCLDQALDYFLNNPTAKTYIMEEPLCKENDFLTALRVYSAKREYALYVKPCRFGKRKKIKFYSEFLAWTDYTIGYKNLWKRIELEREWTIH